MSTEKEAPSDGAFDFHPDYSPAQLRRRLQGTEFMLVSRMLRVARPPGAWTGPFVVGLHRELFGQFFPAQSGRPRTGEINFGRRAGAAPERLDGLLMQLSTELHARLQEALAIKHEGRLLEFVFLAAARSHAEMIRIHPFIDGNGRWARLTTTIFLRDAGLVCGTIIEPSEKRRYIEAIDRAIDEHEPGDLANILARGFVLQASRRRSGHRANQRS